MTEPTLLHLHRLPSHRHAVPPALYRTSPTNVPLGISNWHLLALGILPVDQMKTMLSGSAPLRPGVIWDDLFEHITHNPQTFLSMAYPECPLSWAQGEVLVGLGLEQILRLQQTSLLGHYAPDLWQALRLNPAVRLFQEWSERFEVRQRL